MNDTYKSSGNQLEYDFSSISRIPFYFGPEDKQLLGWIHYKENIPLSDTGLIICPSLGVEYMNAYRPLRYIADYHAQAGVPTLRFDYYGTGDSSGLNAETGCMKDWLGSIELACIQLKKITGCKKVALFGFRMGATLATLVAEKIEVEALILWAALENGRRYIREMKALQLTGLHQEEANRPDIDVLEAGGAIFYPDTVESISCINLINNSPKTKHVLLIPRDDLSSNEHLKDVWQQQGIDVVQIKLRGYADMLVDAHDVKVPHASFLEILEWGEGRIYSADNKVVRQFDVGDLCKSITFKHYNSCSKETVKDGDEVIESIIQYGNNKNRIGILSSPKNTNSNVNLPTVVLANSGANHRVGPNRLYVLIARELNRLGYQCFRIDVDGLGDSVKKKYADENVVYISESSDEIRLAIQSIDNANDENEYVVMGLCSGAYFSFHAALDITDFNIPEVILINPLTFYWREGMSLDESSANSYSAWGWYKMAFREPASWMKILKGNINYYGLIGAVVSRARLIIKSKVKLFMRSAGKYGDFDLKACDLSGDILRLAESKRRLSLFFSRSDPGFDILSVEGGRTVKRMIKDGSIIVRFIENADHTFSRNKPRCELIKNIKAHFESIANKKKELV